MYVITNVRYGMHQNWTTNSNESVKRAVYKQDELYIESKNKKLFGLKMRG